MHINEINKFLIEFQVESDRAAAILGVSYLDTVMENLLKKFFIQNNSFIDKQIFGDSYSVIDSFSKKINLSYALGLLKQKEFEDLNNIRKIRNDFAHELHGLNFNSEKINSRCLNLKCAQDVFDGPLQEVSHDNSARFRYILTVSVLGHLIQNRTENNIVSQKIID
jgi:DNA-binding MltR family transcriptional regulator